MREIYLIARREFKARLRNRAFIAMTFLSPLLLVGFFAFSVYMSQQDTTEHRILVVDDSKLFINRIANNGETFQFEFSTKKLIDAEQHFAAEGYTALLWISPNIIEGGAGACKLFYSKTPGYALQNHIRSQLEKIVYEEKLLANNIQPQIVSNARQHIQLILQQVGNSGTYADQDGISQLGFIMAALMFIFIMMYGMMVFRSVLEEKQSRIVEVLLTSVKPVKLLIGKISGIALLGILQFILMGVLTWSLSWGLQHSILKNQLITYDDFKHQQAEVFQKGSETDFSKLSRFDQQLELFSLFKKVETLAFFEIFSLFTLFFLSGFLFYSAIMSALASAADSDADAQQFLLPVNLPLIASYLIAVQGVINPDAELYAWASWIPFSAPVVMVSRITAGIPLYKALVSWLILSFSFLIIIFWSARIYHNGILNTGKKSRWRDFWHWSKKRI